LKDIATIPFSPANTPFCLLARIETSPAAPSGMTYRENPASGPNMQDNVVPNSKIARRN